MTKEELKQYLIGETERSPEVVNKMCDYSLFNAWLVWNGIIGFTDDIIEVYKAAFGKEYLTFDNLCFSTHLDFKDGKHAKILFNNGYGVSVLFGKRFYSDGISTYEVACIKNDYIVYPENTSFEHDVVGYVTKEEVTKLMKEIQDLPKVKE